MLEALAWFFAFVAAAAVLSYVAASCALPLQDATMERLDRAIGFDWSAWRDALLDRPTAYRLLVVTYNSLFSQFLLVIIYFCKRDRVARIEELMLLMVAALVPTVLTSAIWPTLGPFAALASGDPAELARITHIPAIVWALGWMLISIGAVTIGIRSMFTRRVGLYLQHPDLGADLLAVAGSDPLTVTWAREHHLPPEQWTLDRPVAAALKAADDD